MGDSFSVQESLSGKSWRLRDIDDQVISDIRRKAGVDEIVARMLAARGIEPDEAEAALSPTLRHFFPDPSSFQDMNKAASAIWDAVEAERVLAVFADYDVDGATSAAQLIRYFRQMGQSMLLYVPDRVEEGYGPSADAFSKLKDQGAQLVITVDCGAAAHEPLKAAAEMGLDVNLAKRAGVLHDIGRATENYNDENHAKIGSDIAKKYNITPIVLNAIEAHHGAVDPISPIAVIVQIANQISTQRPGARREVIENFICF